MSQTRLVDQLKKADSEMSPIQAHAAIRAHVSDVINSILFHVDENQELENILDYEVKKKQRIGAQYRQDEKEILETLFSSLNIEDLQKELRNSFKIELYKLRIDQKWLDQDLKEWISVKDNIPYELGIKKLPKKQKTFLPDKTWGPLAKLIMDDQGNGLIFTKRELLRLGMVNRAAYYAFSVVIQKMREMNPSQQNDFLEKTIQSINFSVSREVSRSYEVRRDCYRNRGDWRICSLPYSRDSENMGFGISTGTFCCILSACLIGFGITYSEYIKFDTALEVGRDSLRNTMNAFYNESCYQLVDTNPRDHCEVNPQYNTSLLSTCLDICNQLPFSQFSLSFFLLFAFLSAIGVEALLLLCCCCPRVSNSLCDFITNLRDCFLGCVEPCLEYKTCHEQVVVVDERSEVRESYRTLVRSGLSYFSSQEEANKNNLIEIKNKKNSVTIPLLDNKKIKTYGGFDIAEEAENRGSIKRFSQCSIL